MLHRIKIKNFKCLRDHEFEFKPLTILAGANGSGKSSLIQAILTLEGCYKAAAGDGNVDQEKVFSQKIGAASQVISQDFLDMQEIVINADIGEYSVSISAVLGGSKKQRLSASGNIRDIPQGSFPVFQHLNAERLGPRLSTEFSVSDELICQDGGNAAGLTDIADQESYMISNDLLSENESSKFSYQVEKYLSAIMGDIKLYYEADYDNAITRTTFQTSAAERPVTPPLTGFGYSYALPIVVAGLLCTCFPNMSLIVENPEAHLHPSAQSNMGKFLALLASCGVQVIVETHSEHIIDGARLQLASEKKTDCMRVHFFSYDKQGTSVKQIDVTPKGELTSWPKGFFDQKQTDLRELLQMRTKCD